MEEYKYFYEYDDLNDDFYAVVQGIGEMPVYIIRDTATIVKILSSQEMVHIDDVEGLTQMLIHDNLIPKGSVIKNMGLMT